MATLLTKKEVADRLKVSTRTVNRLVARRSLKVIKSGNIFRVHPDELERFQARHTV